MQQTRASNRYSDAGEGRTSGSGESASGFRPRATLYNVMDGQGQGGTNPAAEAMLRAQLLEARREVSRCQKELEDNQANLRQQQQLLRSAAGEARREVLGLRDDKASLAAKLSQAQDQIQALESEINELKERAQTVASASEASLHDWVDSEALREQVNAKDIQLSVAEAQLKAHKDSQQALNTQVAQLMGQISELVVELEKRQREVQLAAADVVALKTELKASIESRDQAVCRAEVLENELSVLRAEGAEDRISGAAQLLALQQKCEELESRLHASGAVATEGEPATSDATDGEEFAQRQGFSAHSISHKVTASSSEGSARSSPFSNECSPGLKSLLEPTGQQKGVTSPERVACRRSLSLEGALEETRSQGGSEYAAAELQPVTAGSETSLELAADLAAAATYLNQLHRRLQSGPREGIAASGKHVNSELEGAVKSFQAALAVLNAAVDSQAGLRAREEQTTVNLTADSRDAGKVSADVDGEGRQKGFWPRGLFRTALLVPAAAAAVAAVLLPSQV